MRLMPTHGPLNQMSMSPTSMHDVLESIYFITAGPGLLVAAIFGLKSLALAKSSISITETRARLTVTAEQIRYFAESIAPKFDELEAALETAEINLVDKCTIKIEGDGLRVSFEEEPTNLDRFAALLSVFLKARNALAAWCPYLLHGIADEELAYKNLGMDFLHMGQVLIPWIVLCEKESSSEDIISLYTIWTNRLEAEVLRDVAVELVQQAKDLKGRSVHVKANRIIE